MCVLCCEAFCLLTVPNGRCEYRATHSKWLFLTRNFLPNVLSFGISCAVLAPRKEYYLHVERCNRDQAQGRERKKKRLSACKELTPLRPGKFSAVKRARGCHSTWFFHFLLCEMRSQYFLANLNLGIFNDKVSMIVTMFTGYFWKTKIVYVIWLYFMDA